MSKNSNKRRGSKRWLGSFSMIQLDADLEMYHAKDWAKAVAAYEKDPKDFYTAWWFLSLHPANMRRWEGPGRSGAPYSWFTENLEVMVMRVNPETGRIAENEKLNTETAVWVEWGPYMEGSEFVGMVGCDGFEETGSSSHDYRCDTGGASFEEAIVNLAHNVYVLYGGQARVSEDAKLRKRDRW